MAITNIGIFVREQDAVQAHKILHLIEHELIAHEHCSELCQFELPCRPTYDIHEPQIALIEAGIPFDYIWYQCEEFSAGNASVRFQEDGTVLVKFMHQDHIAMIDGNEILRQIRENRFDLADFTQMLEERVDHHTNSDWSHQDEYSKTFLSSDGAVSEKIIKKH